MIFHRDVPLANVVWYRIGGPARYLIDVDNRADLERALEFVERYRPARVLVIGDGSNLIMPDHYFDGVVIRVSGGEAPNMRGHEDGRVEVFGGARINEVALSSLAAGLTGLEWAGGLPGTVGAAVRGNAGAFGQEIARIVHQIEVVSFAPSGCGAETLDRADLAFSYRDSRLKHDGNKIVSSVTFQLRSTDAGAVDAARAVYDRHVAYRRSRHPMEYPSCDSVFKNLDSDHAINLVRTVWPDIERKIDVDWHGKVSMGYVIGRLGMAGMRSGGAEISTKHHNFIINRGGATAADVKSLIDRVQDSVDRTCGFVPEVEIEIIA